ncbi:MULTISPECIES: heparinase II/III family protein [Aeromicrobium]|jgi:hypothetical protein|uniref:Heparinase II/III-like C-terminal domain-containing protein n=1 Tax=Aeromicrobium erythreum TaxID=2041 RepID=A0A0U4CSE2_9ACTN|nr:MULTISPECIES: heparinase II/III family protein [Aeromicrobium]ALX06038.1 hypothetical protein AERYTH_15695 [Aeromicrobium erythreum]
MVRAASRLSLRQVAYHVKRIVRNRIARARPDLYHRYVARVARSVPPLELGRRPARSTELARAVAPFYYAEYVETIDRAARAEFEFFGQKVDFHDVARIDWHHRVDAESDFHLWRMKLGHMGFVCPMLIDGGETHLAAVESLVRGYRTTADFGIEGCFSSYWFPYSVSHRILAILSGYVLALEGRELPTTLTDELDEFLRWNVAFVQVNVEHELRNNHVERNLAALCLYYSYARRVPRRTKRRLNREVRRSMRACVLPDGVIAERSAMYQGLAVMALDVFAKTPFLSQRVRDEAKKTHDKALKAWASLTHPDGEIALFNDSWFEEVPPISDVLDGQDVRPTSVLDSAGYVRLEGEDVFALMDGGAIGPSWNPGHGHADFLSVEVDVAGRRFIVDPGTFQYSTGERRTLERSAASHNGPRVEGLEPVEYLGCFRVGRMARASIQVADDEQSATGELPLPGGPTVRRRVSLGRGSVVVRDSWSGRRDEAVVTLTVSDGWTLVDSQRDRVLFRSDDKEAEIAVTHGDVAGVRDGAWACRYLESRAATLIDLKPSLDSSHDLEWQVAVNSRPVAERVERKEHPA